jgi:site-specific DNA recombinase
MKKAIGYVRVSTEQQAAEGVSLEAQRRKIEAYCELYGFELIAVEVDAGASASTLKREGLERALTALEAGTAEALVVVKLDRLTRSVRDLDALLTRYFAGGELALVSVAEQVDTTTATGRMILNVLMSVSQWEREVIGERTSAALQHKKAQGEYTGGEAPYGYTVAADGVALEECEAEQAVIAAVLEYRAAGLSLRKIGARLEENGFTTRKGGKFWPTAIKNIIEAAA